MGLGKDPDDYGLPPVEVEIPDDARELDRDIQAYRREQRQLRRQRLLRRVARPLLRRGPVPPLVVGVLVIMALAGALMTLFASESAAPVRVPPLTSGSTASAGPTASAGQVGGRLPSGTLHVLGGGPKPLADLSAAVLLTVPDDCTCATTVNQIAAQARTARVSVYLIPHGKADTRVRTLARRAGQGVRVAEDPKRVLATAYHPVRLTAVLVHTDGVVGAVRTGLKPKPGAWLLPELRRLAYPGAGMPHGS